MNKTKQTPYAFACQCGHRKWGIADYADIGRLWHDYCYRHKKAECEPRIEQQHERAQP
jgi:hypothetical protein